MEKCYKCDKKCNELFRLKVINADGEMTFENVCSDECANFVIKDLALLHSNRAQMMSNQIPQKLR